MGHRPAIRATHRGAAAETVTVLQVKLQPHRHQRVAAGHPWVYSNEVVMDAAAKALPPGSIVSFRAADGAKLGVGSFHPHNLICGRLYAAGNATIDKAWYIKKIRTALALREKLFAAPYYRLVHAEADGLPGLIVDRYGQHLTVQMNTAGMDLARDAIIAALDAVVAPENIILRNDSGARLQEGLAQEVTVAKGTIPGRIILQENNLQFMADLAEGQKTGWFYDQRRNRAAVASLCRDGRVLDVYTHTGGFALNAAAGGAKQVTGIDASELALDCAAAAAKLNHLDHHCQWDKGEAFTLLADYATRGERYDVVIADPPAFIKSKKDLAAGTRGYRKLAKLALALVAPGGFFFLASCSHHMELGNLAEQIAHGLHDSGREGQVLQTMFAAPDHPVHPMLPESAYLKGQLLRVTN
ncbi:MAG: class I SAM-dependent rRNA methyltransferase [Alphaproteobacteria bacterium]